MSSGYLTRSDTNQPVVSLKEAGSFKFQFEDVQKKGCAILVAKTKAQISCAVSYCTADLCLCFSHRQKTGFLMAWLIFKCIFTLIS